MHRSRTVNLAIVSALAAAFSGCGNKEETAYCVDKDHRIVENQYCNDEYQPNHYWMYYGGAGSAYTRGSVLTGGTVVDASNKAANAQRGGFGSTSKSGGVGVSFSKSGGS